MAILKLGTLLKNNRSVDSFAKEAIWLTFLKLRFFSEGVSFQFVFSKCFLKVIYKLHHVASIGCTTRLEILKVGFGWMFTSIKNTCRLWWISPNCPKRKPDHLPVPSISLAFALSFREGIVHCWPPPKKKIMQFFDFHCLMHPGKCLDGTHDFADFKCRFFFVNQPWKLTKKRCIAWCMYFLRLPPSKASTSPPVTSPPPKRPDPEVLPWQAHWPGFCREKPASKGIPKIEESSPFLKQYGYSLS